MSMSIGGGKAVCVTGASGYIASWLVKLLLQRGYIVRATVRSASDPSKVSHLKTLEGADERLQLFEANLIDEGSFDCVVDGCEGVFHTASPCFAPKLCNDPQTELIEPAVKGTLNVLRSCNRTSSVKRVVLTSSILAVTYNRNPKGPDVIVDETSFSDPVFCEEVEQWYCLSKILAEQSAWKFAQENGMDLVVMNPGYVIGPILQPTLNYTSSVILNLIKGEDVSFTHRFVDVRDVGRAHILAFENPSAGGRYCLVGTSLTHYETLQIVHKIYPSLDISTITTEEPTYQISKKKAESLGVDFIPFEVSVKDTIQSFKDKNFLS